MISIAGFAQVHRPCILSFNRNTFHGVKILLNVHLTLKCTGILNFVQRHNSVVKIYIKFKCYCCLRFDTIHFRCNQQTHAHEEKKVKIVYKFSMQIIDIRERIPFPPHPTSSVLIQNLKSFQIHLYKNG